MRNDGTAWRGTLITLAVAPAPRNDEMMRVGIIASRKVGNAAIRNQVRRRLREIVRKHQHAVKTGLWLVVIVSARAGGAAHRKLEDEWLRLASRASILAP